MPFCYTDLVFFSLVNDIHTVESSPDFLTGFSIQAIDGKDQAFLPLKSKLAAMDQRKLSIFLENVLS